MQSIFRYPGGKTRKGVRELILSYAPEYSEYREPFVGGGGIYFAVDTGKTRWINDVNQKLICVYKALRDRPESFIKSCKEIPSPQDGEEEVYPKENSKGKKYNARLKSVFDDLSYNEECDQALRYFFINRTVWGGRVNFEPGMESRMYFSNPNGWNIVDTNKLENAARILIGTKITCGKYSPLLSTPGDDVWIYCDPPYYKDTLMTKQSKLYNYGFTKEDHKQFASDAKKCRHKICISYDDDEEGVIRDLYKDFYIHELSWTYCGTSSAKNQSKTKRKGKELLILNYSHSKKRKHYVDLYE